MKAKILFLMALFMTATAGFAQRATDKLDRGLVAVPANSNGGSGSGNFVSWRIFGEEYYDVTYNLYANGQLIKSGLKVSNFTHSAGTSSTKYQVAAVVRGVEQPLSKEVTRWNAGYYDIPVAKVLNRSGADVTSQYILNDISLGDVTGDGITEFIVKRNFTGELNVGGNTKNFNRYECYDLAGNRLWSIDLGPNLMAGPDEQWDLVLFDWDQDGKAECIMRGADNMIIHTSTGHDVKIGNMSYYAPRDEYTHQGAEYLLYLNGETGEPYGWDSSNDAFTPMAYPLPRFETGETDYAAVWGAADTGHRSSKHYFGAPFLDGKHASIFLGRGCYTRHKMCALDVNPITHELTQRWRWNEYSGGSPWFGNGFHNFAIGDVDWDGRDEIIIGSMVIDDNGKGLCTTALGHGDSQHCADLDPYRHGNEQFTCNETSPACTYYNATTGKFLYRLASTGDDGRALAGNFSNSFPGSMGRTTQSGLISLTADKVIDGGPATGGTNDALFWSHLNQRIYWDGDLCDEVLDSPGTEREAAVYKPDGGRLFTSSGCQMNNDSKNNPGALADIFGDWREEIVVRANGSTAIRIYTTPHPTTFRIYTLWHDHQYRNAMVWQCVGYNQTPHKSYFLGSLEGITVAPPPLTTTGRTVIANNGTIGAAQNNQHILVCETDDSQITVENGASPYIATFNVPSWIQGTNSNVVNGRAVTVDKYYTCTVSGAAFNGPMRLVKQGDGILTLPAVEQAYTGSTDIWAGTLNFDGKLLNSSLWLNRFAELNSNGGAFRRIKMDYASILRPGGADNCGSITTDSLTLGFGSRLQLDAYSSGLNSDAVKVKTLSLETKLTGNWLSYGPKYLAPVIEIVPHLATGESSLAEGRYLVFDGVIQLTGKLSDVIIEGVGTAVKTKLVQEEDKIYLLVENIRKPGDVTWTGAYSTTWQFGGDDNFALTNDAAAGEQDFVTGDVVRFTDDATRISVNLKGDIEADSVIVDSKKSYSFSGTGSFVGNSKLIKRGSGTLTINTDNSYTGGTRISEGVLVANSLSNENQALGHLGSVTTSANKFIIENGAELRTSSAVTQGSPMYMMGAEGGVINNSGDFVVNKAISGTVLTKKGNGWMKMNTASSLQRFVVAGGVVQCVNANKVANTLEFKGGTYSENTGSSFAVYVPKGATGVWNTANRASYTNKVTGEGTLTIYCEEEKGNTWFATRTQLCMDFSDFAGQINATGRSDDSGARWTLNTANGMPNGTLNIADGLTVQNTARTFAIGRLAGKGRLGGYASFSSSGGSGANTWRVGNDATWSWAGSVTDNSNLIKVGSGKATFTGASDHTGTTRVDAGELHFTNATLGTGTLTVSRGAVLSGNNTAAKSLTNSSVSISAGGTLQVGAAAESTTGQIDFGGKNVTFAKGSFLQIGVARAASGTATGVTNIQNIGTLTMNGTIQLHYASSLNLHVGDSIILWRSVNKTTGTPVLEQSSYYIAEGLFWDDKDLAQGILRVTDIAPVGIRGLDSDADVSVQVISTAGVVVEEFDAVRSNVERIFRTKSLPRGFYILRMKAGKDEETIKLRK